MLRSLVAFHLGCVTEKSTTSSKVIFIVKYKRGYPVLFGQTQKDVVTAGFLGFGLTGRLGGAEQTVYC